MFFLTFFIFYLFRNVIINQKEIEKKNLEKTQNNDLFISLKQKNSIFFLLKNHLLYPNLTTRCQKVEKKISADELKLLLNLIGWKTEYLIAQLRTVSQQKLFRLKTYPQGVLQAQ